MFNLFTKFFTHFRWCYHEWWIRVTGLPALFISHREKTVALSKRNAMIKDLVPMGYNVIEASSPSLFAKNWLLIDVSVFRE